MAILFFEKVANFTLKGKNPVKKWIKDTIEAEGFKVGDISVVFVDDKELFEINKKYLNHKYYTDIVTFNYNKNDLVNGDLVISVDRIYENARKYKVSVKDELLRVIIHGILHLMGFDDITNEQKRAIRKKENECLMEICNREIRVDGRI